MVKNLYKLKNEKIYELLSLKFSMPEIRKDPITGKNVVIVSDEDREQSFYIAPCPLCEGKNLTELVQEVKLTCTIIDSKGIIQALAFPYKNPILNIESPAESFGVNGIYDAQKGHGAAERLISLVDPEEPLSLELMFKVYRHRINDLKGDREIRYVQLSKTYHPNAIEKHLHSRLLAFPNVTATLEDELNKTREHYKEKERCKFCDIINEETGKERVISENNDFIAFVNFAAKAPYDLSVLPKNHSEDFGKITDSEIKSLTELMHPIAMVLREMCDKANKEFDWSLHTVPFNTHLEKYKETLNYWHWHLEVRPDINVDYLIGTGMYHNIMPPEKAARELRELLQR